MKEDATLVHNISKDELVHNILQGLEVKLKEFETKFQPKEPTTWLTKKEVATILSISTVTVDDWSRKGILNPFRIGNRIRFQRNEVEKSLIKINE
ncbi:helix-turn-helix domain-containing protein [Lutibacter citreus]|uniref:helix-turn-helix domain-containing protein n=1 Tax=Lutibacter citreus TaxID=2138210 RepID=UPI000DBE2CE2|nr:helix-turn-helix domain-containing protein [Lutibacter citreus]